MVPSSPKAPCSTGKTTSTWDSSSLSRPASTATRPWLEGSPARTSPLPSSTEGSSRPRMASCAESPVPSTQRPSRVIPTGTASNRSGSRLPRTQPADRHEMVCSLLRPPNTTATRIFSLMVSHRTR